MKKKKEMIPYVMVSFDTSSSITGYAKWENGKLTEHGIFDCSKEKDTEIRLENMCLAIINYLQESDAKTVVVELNVVPTNANTQRLLSEIIGVCRGWAYDNYAEFVTYRPSVWRKLNCNIDEKAPTKRADAKEWSINKVNEVFNIIPKDDNDADAILIGRARINEFNNNEA